MVTPNNVLIAYLELQFIDIIENLVKDGKITLDQAGEVHDKLYDVLNDMEETLL